MTVEALMSEAYAIEEEQGFTYADYKAWELKPGERFELIYGVAYAMSVPNLTHQQILMTLSGEFYSFLWQDSAYLLRTYHVQDLVRPGVLPGMEIPLSAVFADGD